MLGVKTLGSNQNLDFASGCYHEIKFSLEWKRKQSAVKFCVLAEELNVLKTLTFS